MTPTDIIARVLSGLGLTSQTCELFDLYDEFLIKLNSEEMRRLLSELTPEAARNEPHFREFKILGRSFQDTLIRIFFDSDSELAQFTKEYGVF